LPYSTNIFNNNWISNKSRLFFDGLSRQRLSSPAISFNSSARAVNKASWKQVFFLCEFFFERWRIFSLSFSKIFLKGYATNYMVFGSIIDLQTIFFANKLSCLVSFIKQLECFIEFPKAFKPIFKSNYLFSLNTLNLKLAKTLLLIGLDLAKESPIFNVALTKIAVQNNFPLYSVGFLTDCPKNTNSLGISSKTLIFFFKGRLLICRDFCTANPQKTNNTGFSLFSSSILFREDGFSSCFFQKLDFLKFNTTFIPIIPTQNHVYECNI